MIDLHMHTVNSDGFCTTAEVLALAQERGLSAISITDHNSVGAYYELDCCRGLFGGVILPGIEINTTYNKEIIEILGYGIDVDMINAYASSSFMPLPEKRQMEYELSLKTYREAGIKFDESKLDFDPHKFTPKFAFFSEVIKYPENDKFFLYKESKTDKNIFLRNESNNPESPFFIDVTSIFPSIDSVIEAIHNAGGLAFLAHTFAYSPNIAAALDDIAAHGLDGLECKYSSFTEEQSKWITNYCNERHLLKSGGSDFHGEKYRPNCVMGSLNIDESFVSQWFKKQKLI